MYAFVRIPQDDLSQVQSRYVYTEGGKHDANGAQQMLDKLCAAPDRAAWTTIFDHYMVIGYAPSLKLYYVYAERSLWVTPSVNRVLDKLFSGTQYCSPGCGCNCRECVEYGLTTGISFDEAEQSVRALFMREELTATSE